MIDETSVSSVMEIFFSNRNEPYSLLKGRSRSKSHVPLVTSSALTVIYNFDIYLLQNFWSVLVRFGLIAGRQAAPNTNCKTDVFALFDI